jgi:hypothetical protein
MFGFDSDCAGGIHEPSTDNVISRSASDEESGLLAAEETGKGSKTVPRKGHPITEWLQPPGSLK